MDEVVSREVAEQEFDRFCEAMALEFDPKKMDDEDRQGLATHRDRFVTACMRGRLSVNDAGEAVLTCSADGSDVTFSEPSGEAMLELDRAKKGHAIQGLFLYMAKVTGRPPKFFSDMKKRDLDVCMSIANLFLA